MVLVLAVGGGLGWFIHRATIQRDAVKAIVAATGTVGYDFQQFHYVRDLPGPKWLVDLVGIDFFADVVSVTIRTPQTDAILLQVGRLHRLKWLDAPSVQVTDAGLARLAGLPEIRSLSCSGAPELTDAGLAHLAGLGRLEALSIYGTRIEGSGLAHLTGLKQLKYLAIGTKTDAEWSSLAQLIGLRNLSIETPKIGERAIFQLSRLTQLEQLAFGGESGSDAELGHLKALANLQTLQLYGPWFTDAGLAPVAEMDHISNFFVADQTSVTAAGLNHLQRQRPTLQIGVNGSGQVPRARLDALRRSVGPGAISAGPQ